MRQPDTATDTERLRRLLGGDELSWLVERTRTRLERGLGLDGTVVLEPAAPAQRRAVARLLGRPAGRGTSLRVSLPAVEAVLRRGGLASELASAVEALRGPVVDRTAGRAADAAAWAAAYAAAEKAVERHAALAPWLEWLRDTGLLRRCANGDPETARSLAEQAAAVLRRLPAGGRPLSVLAATAAGDEHALDPGRPMTALVLRAAAILGEVPPGDDAEWRRTVWASVGVLTGELTNPVLTLSLPGDLRTVTGRALAVWADAGQPVHLTARQLLRDPPDLPVRDRRVFVCENLTVVAEAASRLGARSAPLVCANPTQGPPPRSCCASWPPPGPGSATTATSTGQGSPSPTASSAASGPARGGSTAAPTGQRLRSAVRACAAARSPPPGTSTSPRRCWRSASRSRRSGVLGDLLADLAVAPIDVATCGRSL